MGRAGRLAAAAALLAAGAAAQATPSMTATMTPSMTATSSGTASHHVHPPASPTPTQLAVPSAVPGLPCFFPSPIDGVSCAAFGAMQGPTALTLCRLLRNDTTGTPVYDYVVDPPSAAAAVQVSPGLTLVRICATPYCNVGDGCTPYGTTSTPSYANVTFGGVNTTAVLGAEDVFLGALRNFTGGTGGTVQTARLSLTPITSHSRRLGADAAADGGRGLQSSTGPLYFFTVVNYLHPSTAALIAAQPGQWAAFFLNTVVNGGNGGAALAAAFASATVDAATATAGATTALNGSSSGWTGGAIAGLVIGIIALLLVGAVIVYATRRRTHATEAAAAAAGPAVPPSKAPLPALASGRMLPIGDALPGGHGASGRKLSTASGGSSSRNLTGTGTSGRNLTGTGTSGRNLTGTGTSGRNLTGAGEGAPSASSEGSTAALADRPPRPHAASPGHGGSGKEVAAV
jgi:hypothetical protein